MCPICITTALLTLSGVAGTGGLAAVAVRKFGGRLVANGDEQVMEPNPKDKIEDEDDDEYEDEQQRCISKLRENPNQKKNNINP